MRPLHLRALLAPAAPVAAPARAPGPAAPTARLHRSLHPLARFVRSSAWIVLPILLWLVGFAYYGQAAVLRHARFESNALDMGFMDQAAWNTAQGRPLKFSLYRDPVVLLDIPVPKHRITNYLAFHAEVFLMLLAPLYWWWPGPETLLLAQALIATAGVVPAFLLARRLLRSPAAALVFALAYLLSPALEAGLLSDYHSVALTPAFFLAAFLFLEQRRPAAFVTACLLAVSTKEEVGLMAALLGLYAAWRYRMWIAGPLVAGLSLAWVGLMLGIVMPHFNGGETSLLADRYAYLGERPGQMLVTLLTRPDIWMPHLANVAALSYVGGLLAEGGLLALLNPLQALMAGPEVGINLLSTFDWMHSGGGHYSAPIVPFVLVASMRGCARLRGWLGRFWREPAPLALCLASLLGVALGHHLRAGVSPLTPGDALRPPSRHDRVGAALARAIPPGATVSAGSTPLPHVSDRADIYPFPTLNGAEYVLLDVTANAYPLPPLLQRDEVRRLLRESDFRVYRAVDGWLLLRRGEGKQELPEEFYTFTRATPDQVRWPRRIRFGDQVEFVGLAAWASRTIGAQNPILRLSTFWRALTPAPRPALSFHFLYNGPGAGDGYLQPDPTATSLWRPAAEWPQGELMRVDLPPIEFGGYTTVDVIVSTSTDPRDRAARLQPSSPATILPQGQSTSARIFGG